MAAMIFILPPHLMQVSTSMLKTLGSSRAQGMFFFFSSSCFGSMMSCSWPVTLSSGGLGTKELRNATGLNTENGLITLSMLLIQRI